MRALAFVILSTVALAACDAPDPSAFHHALRSDAMTGTHLNGVVGSGEFNSSDGTHDLELLQRMNNLNTLANKP